jgi:hypothetical protein
MALSFNFNAQTEIQKAWDQLWSQNLKARASTAFNYRKSATYYLTAADIERKVRDNLEKEAFARGDFGPFRIRGALGNKVRDWLLSGVRQGRLDSHNFGRGHISGMRFRPKGEEISETEKDTMKKRERSKGRPKPVHLREGGNAACAVARAAAAGRKLWGFSRSRAYMTDNHEDVNCPTCKKLAAKAK